MLEAARLTKRCYKFFKDNKEQIKEGISDLKVIYSDLDGTLFNDRGCIIKDSRDKYYFKAINLLEKINENGWDLVLVSGRNKYQLRYNAQMIGVKNYIAELGSELVYDQGKEVHVTFDNGKESFDITYEGKDLVRIMELLMKEFPGKIESRMEWSRYRSFNALFFGEIDLDKANKLLQAEGYGSLVLVDNGFSNLVDLELKVDRLHIYNLMPRGVNKANAVRLDKKLRGFNDENCIALGDSLEDLKMASEVKYFFLMKNALEHEEELEPELDKYGNVFITDSIMNRGWFEVMSELLG
ncbi:MAG: HAD family phosphatase [Gammaproteobacteria bacterium]|nr:HAD family phosphatase [Gammaproteobacteria bacterium]